MVTVVITTCKRNAKIVERAIKSVITQTYKDWELIVVDDSPDTFSERSIVRNSVYSFSEGYSITYIPNATNAGACHARNIGLNMARGEYIAYLDDDDEWLPLKLEEQVSILHMSSQSTALVYSPYIIFNESMNQKTKHIVKPRSGMLYDELMKDGNFIGGLSMPMMRTECLRNIGGFDEQMQSVQDMDLWLRLSQKYEIVFCPKYHVLYHVHTGEQITSNPKKKIAGIERLREKNWEYISEHNNVGARFLRSLSKYYMIDGDHFKSLKLWMQSVCLEPFAIETNVKQLGSILLKCSK